VASEEGKKKYPELHALAEELARKFLKEIDERAGQVKSKMPYRAQYTLEEVVRIMEQQI
jgi:GH25 family lysozyme M1 (1,4-beta-N-acetylmuramidase)